MASGEDVQLPDLQVIQRYSLAVRGATAPVEDVVEALQADLAWLTGRARARPAEPAKKQATEPAAPVAKKAAPVAKKAAPVAKKAAPVTKKGAPVAKKAAPVAKKQQRKAATSATKSKKAVAKRSGARRA